MNIYVASDTKGVFLVDAEISDQIGQPIPSGYHSTASSGQEKLKLDISVDGKTLASSSIAFASTNNEIPFSLTGLTPRFEAYNVSIKAKTAHGDATFSASSQLFYLPSRNDGGTVARLDNLYGALEYQKSNSSSWKAIFPYTYYVQWSLYWYANLTTLDDFAAKGYNVIHIVPTGDLGDTPFPWDKFMPYLDRADELGLLFQFDVRFSPDNFTVMYDVVDRLRTHPSMLLWYVADEPDGKSNPLNATGLAREAIRSLDPYHPTSLALNCYDFYYSDYAAGADIILSDVYPISTNTSYSTVYDTPCNLTYGCCGCDDCHGVFEDISDRLDQFAHFDDLIGWDKLHWGVPQAFGNETFWTRYPTGAEEAVMTMMYINHGAKGIVMWDYPTKPDILDMSNRLAKVLPTDEVASYLIGEPIAQGLTVRGGNRIDAAAWTSKDTKTALVSVINLKYADVSGSFSVQLPDGLKAASITKVFWGDATWTVKNGRLAASQLPGLEVSLLEVSFH